MRFTTFQLNIGCNIFKALSEESRLRIMFLLYTNGNMCISDIEQILDFTQSKTSRHITYLKNCGLLNVKKKDQWAYYYIKEEYMGFITQTLAFMEKVLSSSSFKATFSLIVTSLFEFGAFSVDFREIWLSSSLIGFMKKSR